MVKKIDWLTISDTDFRRIESERLVEHRARKREENRKAAMQKTIYMLTVTRGTRSRYFYGEKLKDALAAAGLRTGEKFTYAKFVRGAVANAKLVRPGVYATV